MSRRWWLPVFLVVTLPLPAAPPRVPVSTLAFSPDDSALLVGRHRAVEVVRLGDQRITATIPCVFPRVASLAFSPDGRWLFVAGGAPGESGGVQVFNWPGLKLAQTLTNRSDTVTGIALHPAGSEVALAGADHVVELWRLDSASGQLGSPRKLVDHSRPVLAAAFSSDGQWLVSASADRSLKVWTAADGTLLRSFSHHTDIVHAVAFRPRTFVEGQPVPFYCASGSDDQTVRVWQPEIGRMVRIVRHHEGAVFAVAYSRDGTRLYSAGKEGIVREIDADSDEILRHWPAHADWIYALTLEHAGARLATGDWAGRVKVWSIQPGAVRELLALP